MKKILSAILLFATIASAHAQTVQEDLVGLGMNSELADYLAGIIPAGAALDNNVYLKGNNQAGSADINIVKIDTSDNTVVNSSASDELILQFEDDSNRKVSFTAASDAALVMKFGDGGNTADQQLLISHSTSDGDDDGSIEITAGGAHASNGTRGAYIYMSGADNTSGGAAAGGDIYYNAAASQTHIFATAGSTTGTIGATGLITAAAGLTATAGDITSTAGNVILSAQDQQVQVLSGVSAVDADVITASSDSTTVAYLGSNTSGNNLTMVSNVADAVGGSLKFLKTRAAANAWNANTIVAANDDIGDITAYGADGAEYINAAQILFESDGTPGLTTDMPGRIVFKTVPDGSGTLTTALTLSSAQAATFTGAVTSSATGALGWSYVTGANTACTTTCTSAAVFGVDLAAGASQPVIVDAASATADACVCAGAS